MSLSTEAPTTGHDWFYAPAFCIKSNESKSYSTPSSKNRGSESKFCSQPKVSISNEVLFLFQEYIIVQIFLFLRVHTVQYIPDSLHAEFKFGACTRSTFIHESSKYLFCQGVYNKFSGNQPFGFVLSHYCGGQSNNNSDFRIYDETTCIVVV